MKKTLSLCVAICFTIALQAKTLPSEPSIVTGTLPNGMKYSIMENAKPKSSAELKLLVKVGSLEEEDDQQGIAHFTEHMAFNGSKDFQKNELIDYLESIGVSFGSHLNASTGFERTLYKLSVPLKGDNLEKSFLVLENWAEGLSFDKEEFNKERGVILEEARSRNTLGYRLRKKFKHNIFANSKYLKRFPIGDLNTIKTIDVKRAKEFYDTWYRPEFMHFVAVGDFNANDVKKLITKHFSKLSNNSDKKRASRIIPENKTTRIQFLTDREATGNSLSINYIQKRKPLRTEEDLRLRLTRAIAMSLFNLETKKQFFKDDPKANVISMSESPLSINNTMISFSAMYHELDEIAALQEVSELIFSFEKYGFSKENMETIKKKLHNSNENSYKRRHDKSSDSIASSITKKALSGSIYIDYDDKYKVQKELITDISLEDVNHTFKNLVQNEDKFIVFVNTTGNKESKRNVLKALANAKENTKDLTKVKKMRKKLLDKTLNPVKIVNETHDKKTDIHRFELENGIKVTFKKTDFSKNKIILSAFSFGGYSIYETADLNDAKKAATYIAKSGAGDYTIVDLSKILSGKSVRASMFVSEFSEGIEGGAASHDMDTLFELMYLKLTEPKIDKRLIKNAKKILTRKVKNASRSPKYKFKKELSKFYYKDNPRKSFDTAESIAALNAENMIKIYKDRFSDMNNFSFVIVGDADVNDIKRTTAKYLGNLPTQSRQESYNKRDNSYLTGKQTFKRDYNNENISKISLSFKSTLPYSVKDSAALNALTSILKVRLRKLIREDKSAIYGISANGGINRLVDDLTTVSIKFTCDPERREELVTYIQKEIDKIKSELVDKSELEVFKTKFSVSYKKRMKKNKYWLMNIVSSYKYGTDIQNIFKKPEIVDSVSAQDIKRVANIVFSKDVLHTQLNPK